jgi:DNA primase
MSEKLTKVELTNLSKTLFPKLKITKAQVIEYYIKIAPKMLVFLAERPLVLTRFPDGISQPGFYEKDPHPPIQSGFPRKTRLRLFRRRP